MGQGNLSSPAPLKKEPEYDMTTEELIRYWNYTSETYEAETPDGYVLTLHRIPHGKTGTMDLIISFFSFSFSFSFIFVFITSSFVRINRT